MTTSNDRVIDDDFEEVICLSDSSNKSWDMVSTNIKDADKIQETVIYFTTQYDLQNNSAESKFSQVKCTIFHNALAKGDVGFASRILQQIGDDVCLCDFVVNSLVRYDDTYSVYDMVNTSAWAEQLGKELTSSATNQNSAHLRNTTQTAMFELPLSMAASSGNFAAVELLLEHGASLFTQDTAGNNLLHDLVTLSQHQPALAVGVFHSLCQHLGVISNTEEKHRLAFTENHSGQRPLDVAAKLCLPEMMLALLRWDNVYRFVLDECGPFQQTFYDVSRYQDTMSGSHVLRQIVLATEQDVIRLDRCRFVEQEPIKTWIETIDKMTRKKRALFKLVWICYIVMFFYTVNQFSNKREKYIPNFSLTSLLLSASAIEVVTQVGNSIQMGAALDASGIMYVIRHRGGLPIAFTPVYKAFQFKMAALVFVIELLHLLNVPYAENKTLYTSLYACAVCAAWLSFLLFIQVSSSIAHLLIIMDQLVHKASLLYGTVIILWLEFPLALYVLQFSSVDSSSSSAHSNQTSGHNTTANMTPGEYITNNTQVQPGLFQTIYDTILYGQGLLPPSSLYFRESLVPGLSVTVYVMLLIAVTLVLTNLAIAVMSDRATELHEHRNTLLVLQRLSMSITMTFNSRCLPQCCQRLNIVKHFKKHSDDSYFVRSKDLKLVFLRVTEKITKLLDRPSDEL